MSSYLFVYNFSCFSPIAGEGIDFQLFGVPHHCHKADIYLSRFSTCDSRPCSKTALEEETVSIFSANGARLLWFFLHGHFGSSFTFKDIGTTFHAILLDCETSIKPLKSFSLLTV